MDQLPRCPKCGSDTVAFIEGGVAIANGVLMARCFDCGHQWLQDFMKVLTAIMEPAAPNQDVEAA